MDSLTHEIETFTEFIEQYGQFVVIGPDKVVRGYYPEDIGSGMARRIELGERAYLEMFFQNCLDF